MTLSGLQFTHHRYQHPAYFEREFLRHVMQLMAAETQPSGDHQLGLKLKI